MEDFFLALSSNNDIPKKLIAYRIFVHAYHFLFPALQSSKRYTVAKNGTMIRFVRRSNTTAYESTGARYRSRDIDRLWGKLSAPRNALFFTIDSMYHRAEDREYENNDRVWREKCLGCLGAPCTYRETRGKSTKRGRVNGFLCAATKQLISAR